MALKDLVAQKSVLREEAIEEIVSEYIRYDPAEKAVSFTPKADSLSNKAKVLVYLVALQGWPFVSDDDVPVDAKPADIEEHVGIRGGSLRPTLKELKDSHVIAERGGRYFVREVSLATIKDQLGGGGTQSSNLKSRVRRARRVKSIAEQKQEAPTADLPKGAQRFRKRKSVGNLAERFDTWINDGFFDTRKTLNEVKSKFHKEGMIVPSTSIPKYLLRALRAGRLERDREQIDQKEVWVYRRNRKKK